MKRAYSSASSGGGGGGGTPGGATTNVQYNDAGVFGGDANNTWNKTTKIATYTKSSLGTTSTSSVKVTNSTAAAVGAQQVSPSVEWEAQGWKTNGTPASQPVNFREYVLPIQGFNNPDAILKLQSSINSAAYTDLLDLYTRNQDGNSGGLLLFKGSQELEFSQSNQDPNTSKALQLTNTSGQYTNINWKFGATIKSALTLDNAGNVYFKKTGSSFYFMSGTTISSQSEIAEIYSGGLFCNGGGFFNGRVTAGSAQTTPPATLNTYGSFAGRGSLVTGSTHLLDDTDFAVYGDADTAFLCGGTPSVTACSTYTGSGQVTCESHLPCAWSSTACSTFSGVDQSTCETSHPGCTFASTSCSGANNTDSGTCLAQDDSFGGSCAWDTTTCPAQTTTAACNAISGCTASEANSCSAFTDEATCNAQVPCSATMGNCSAFDNTDQATCEANVGCSYAGDPVCSGTYFISCDGNYFDSCSGNLCGGNYYNGTCSGTWDVCSGTATCGNYPNSGACSAEAGCTPSSGATWTLPLSSVANQGNVSRFYYLKNIGASATINVVANTGDTLESAITLMSGDAVTVHHYKRTADCTDFTSEGACTPSGCSWVPAIVCSDYNGDESACNAHSGSGCSYSDPTCSGAGTAANCIGSYISSSKWYLL